MLPKYNLPSNVQLLNPLFCWVVRAPNPPPPTPKRGGGFVLSKKKNQGMFPPPILNGVLCPYKTTSYSFSFSKNICIPNRHLQMKNSHPPAP